MIVIAPCHADDAQKLWPRCLQGIDPAEAFGPDVEPDRLRADRCYTLASDGQLIGLGWVRRFTRLGHVVSYGKALFPEHRGRGLSRSASIELVRRIFVDYPDAALIAFIWGSNPQYSRLLSPSRLDRHPNVHPVGEIVDALPTGESLHIVQILRATETPVDPYPESEWHGAPHAQGERR